MFATGHDFFRDLAQARKATRRGDVAATERWIKCAEKHIAIAERFQKLAEREEAQRPQINPWPAPK
ncbi:MAG: hypothetical protein ACT4OF_15370 [Caulobacteraceae bacterium]